MGVATGNPHQPGGMSVDRDREGRIAVVPLTGFGLSLVKETVCLLRVEFARTPDQLKGETREAVQLALTPEQALRLAQELTITAHQAVKPPMKKLRN